MAGDFVDATLLGIVEGLTEFLPVSSTGHLVLASALLGYDEEKWRVFNVVIQLGAILAVVVLYWRTFQAVLIGLAKREPASWRFLRNILLAFLPAAAVGLAVHKQIEALLLRPDVVAVALIAGGVAILVIERLVKTAFIVGVADVPVARSLGIGVIQCISMIPGVSRSGATIMGALSLGVERRTAAEFSFFLAVPTMLGATVLELAKNWRTVESDGVGLSTIGVGFLVSFVVAILVIRAFVTIISRSGFAPFAWYRIAIGILALAWLRNV